MTDFIHKIGLRVKFAVIFISSILLISSIIYISWKNLSDQNSALKGFSERSLPSINFLLQLDRDLHQALIALKDILKTEDPDKTSKLQESYSSNMGQVTERWNKYKALAESDKERSLFGSFEKEFASWKGEADGLLSDYLSKNLTDPLVKADREKTLTNRFDISREYINQLTEIVEVGVTEINEQNSKKYSSATNAILVIFVLSIISTVTSWFFFSANIIKPVILIKEKATEVASGNTSVSVQIKNKEEIGHLADAFNRMTVNIEKLFKEANDKTLEAEKAARMAEEAGSLAKEQQKYLSESVNSLLGEMDKFAAGDLTVSLQVKKADDIGRLYTGFNTAVENLRNTLLSVAGAVDATASSANEISSSSEEMAAGAHEQTQQSSEIASAVEEMTRTILETSQNINQAAAISRQASSEAEKGSRKIDETREGIRRIVSSAGETAVIINSLARKSDQIGEITQVINDIADQTNLLALNAAIEAARAGEQGRGFAVVADEVRKLAERTTRATREISDTIKSIQMEAKQADSSMITAKQEVVEGTRLTEEVAQILNNILKEVTKTTDLITQVAAASDEQSATSEQISKNIESVSSVTQQSAAATEQIARAAEDLSNLTVNLQSMVSRFKLRENILA